MKLIGEYSTVVQPVQDAKTVYTTNDHLGSPRVNTDATGQVISATTTTPLAKRSPAPATAPTPSANSSPATNEMARLT